MHSDRKDTMTRQRSAGPQNVCPCSRGTMNECCHIYSHKDGRVHTGVTAIQPPRPNHFVSALPVPTPNACPHAYALHRRSLSLSFPSPNRLSVLLRFGVPNVGVAPSAPGSAPPLTDGEEGSPFPNAFWLPAGARSAPTPVPDEAAPALVWPWTAETIWAGRGGGGGYGSGCAAAPRPRPTPAGRPAADVCAPGPTELLRRACLAIFCCSFFESVLSTGAKVAPWAGSVDLRSTSPTRGVRTAGAGAAAADDDKGGAALVGSAPSVC